MNGEGGIERSDGEKERSKGKVKPKEFRVETEELRKEEWKGSRQWRNGKEGRQKKGWVDGVEEWKGRQGKG